MSPAHISTSLLQLSQGEQQANGVPDVTIRVLNAPNDEAAFVRVREVLALFKH